MRRPLLVFASFVLTSPLCAQGNAADYTRAESLAVRVRGQIVNAVNQTNWIGETPWLWYRKTTPTGTAYVVVDAEHQQRAPAFDQARLAQALGVATRKPVSPDSLPLNGLTFTNDRSTITFSPDSVRYRCTLADYRCAVAMMPREGRGGRDFGGGILGVAGPVDVTTPRVSPDSLWEASVRNNNISSAGVTSSRACCSAPTARRATRTITRSIVWSPDSKHIAAYRVRPGFRREVHYVESSPEDQLQPKHSTLLYSKPGDVLDVEQPVLFDVAAQASRSSSTTRSFRMPTTMTRARVAQGQPRGHVRVQPARTSGVSRHRGRCRAPAKRARVDRRADADLLRVLGEEVPLRHRRREGDHLDVGARRVESPLSVRRRHRAR